MTWTINPASSGWSIVAGVLKYGPATLPADNPNTEANEGEISVHVIATTTSADCGTIPNTANLTFSGGSGSDDAEVEVQCPDLTVIKSGNGPILNGATATFTITLSNQGPGDAYLATLSDQLPAGTWTLGGPDAEDCDISGTNLLTCDFGTVEAPGGESALADDHGQQDRGHSRLRPDPEYGDRRRLQRGRGGHRDNSDDAWISRAFPSIDIVKTADDDKVEPNQVVTFTIAVEVVNGPVTNAVITDGLPAGQTYVAGSGAPSRRVVSPNGRTLTWTFASLATGGSLGHDHLRGDDRRRRRRRRADEHRGGVRRRDPRSATRRTRTSPSRCRTSRSSRPPELRPTARSSRPRPVGHLHLRGHEQRSAGAAERHGHRRRGHARRHQRRLRGDCPKTTLAAGESMTCTATVAVLGRQHQHRGRPRRHRRTATPTAGR